jgi:methylase of polypeptide subunit release factors
MTMASDPTGLDRETALADLLGAIAATGYGFVPPTPETHRRVNARAGNDTARDLRGIFGWSRPFQADVAGARICGLLRAADALDATGALLKSRLRVATLNGRLYLHSAFPTLASDAVFFGPDTYRFARALLNQLPQRSYDRAVDLGCGSGAGGLAVAAARPISELWLTDINPAALVLASVNARHQGWAARCAASDLLRDLPGEFDLIIANPPYLVDPAGRSYRDGGGALGLDLGLRIVSEGTARLARDGVLFLYTGVPIIDGIDHFGRAMEQIIDRTRFDVTYSEIDPDVFGEELDNPAYRNADRIAAVSLFIQRLRT